MGEQGYQGQVAAQGHPGSLALAGNTSVDTEGSTHARFPGYWSAGRLSNRNNTVVSATQVAEVIVISPVSRVLPSACWGMVCKEVPRMVEPGIWIHSRMLLVR